MPSSSPKSTAVDAELRRLDVLLASAGLVRTPRGQAAARRAGLNLLRTPAEALHRPAPEPVVAANGVHWLAVPGWEKYRWLRAGFSTRKGGQSRAYTEGDAPGELNLGFTAEDPREVVLANRRLLAEAIAGSADLPLISLKQIHSGLVRRATAADAARALPLRADGHFTAEPGLLLAVQTADCIPILVADRKKKIISTFHAGWRGTVKRIVELGVGRLRMECGSRPEDLIAAIGPGAGPCCYAVGKEVIQEFTSQFAYAAELFHEVDNASPVRAQSPTFLNQRPPGHAPTGSLIHLDLIEANRRQLLAAGLKPSAIHLVGGCTSCQPDLFFSHRASQGHAGRMLAVIGIRPR